MNYLAHAFLSFNDEKLLVGNLLGDFVKGRKSFESYSDDIQKGILLHRHIDYYSDNHLILKQSIQRLKPTQNRYAPVVVDILYDYFLANNWALFSDESIEVFANRTYRQLENNFDLMPQKVQNIFSRMIEGDWLINYQDESGIDYTFQRIITRVTNENNMLNAIDDLRTHKADLNEDFKLFFPDLIKSTKDKIIELKL